MPKGVGSTTLTSHSGKTGEVPGLFFHFRKYFCLGIAGDVVSNGEGSIRSGSFGMHTSLRGNLTIKVGEFFQKPDIL